MARFFKILITSGTSPGPYTVYYDSINPANYATRVSTNLPATGITYVDLTTGTGVSVEVPDIISSVILYNETCETNVAYVLPTPTPTPTQTPEPAYNYYTLTGCAGGSTNYRSILPLALNDIISFTDNLTNNACYEVTDIFAPPNTNDLPTVYARTGCGGSDCIQA